MSKHQCCDDPLQPLELFLTVGVATVRTDLTLCAFKTVLASSSGSSLDHTMWRCLTPPILHIILAILV